VKVPTIELVYYMRRADWIKIGTTRNLPARMRALRPGEVLAIEPGGRDIEHGRHRMFREFNVADAPGTEWFHVAPRLMEHIELMARIYPVKDWRSLPPVWQETSPAPTAAPAFEALTRLMPEQVCKCWPCIKRRESDYRMPDDFDYRTHLVTSIF
jgi:hypothetical protein